MRLSEAILLGSVGSEQGFGPMSICSDYERGRCALGSALLAMGIRTLQMEQFGSNSGIGLIKKMWTWTTLKIRVPEELATKPNCVLSKEEAIVAVIWALNDVAKWTRPQIAAWVAEQEVTLGIVDQEPVKVELMEEVTA